MLQPHKVSLSINGEHKCSQSFTGRQAILYCLLIFFPTIIISHCAPTTQRATGRLSAPSNKVPIKFLVEDILFLSSHYISVFLWVISSQGMSQNAIFQPNLSYLISLGFQIQWSNCLQCILFLFTYISFFSVVWNQAQGLVHAGQSLYNWSLPQL